MSGAKKENDTIADEMAEDSAPEPLPEDGPLVRAKETYAPTNADLLANTYRQNRAINYVVRNTQTLRLLVKNQGGVLEELMVIRKSIHRGLHWVGWALSFLGLAGVAAVINLLRHWIIRP